MTITIREWGYLEYPYYLGDGSPYLDSLIFGQMGAQFQTVSLASFGAQFRSVIYNTTNLRIMCDFPSRGQVGTGGTNAWGQTKGTGLNWQASSTKSGDFSVNNVNTDIVEQIWRSDDGDKTSVILKCDTEIAQGIFTDTLSIENHNLTSSATVLFQGSTSSTFATIGISISLQITPTNIKWISPELPIAGYRYWRLVIDDASNMNDFLSIGTILFGVAEIFTDGGMTDELDFGDKDFADTVNTEGFTNVANSRALKRVLSLQFQSQDIRINNWTILKTLLKDYRTTHKCLWIPTPDAVDMRITDQFAVFAKIVPPLPVPKINYKGPLNQYATIAISLDESL